MAKLKPNPKITATGAEGFLQWLRRDLPDVFNALANRNQAVAAWASGDASTIGFDFSAIFSGVGNAITQALPTIASAAGTLAVSNANKKLIEAQAKLAQAQAAPFQTAYASMTANSIPQLVAVNQVPQQTVQRTASGQYISQAQSVVKGTDGNYYSQGVNSIGGIPTKYLLLGGGVALILVMMLAMRRN